MINTAKLFVSVSQISIFNFCSAFKAISEKTHRVPFNSYSQCPDTSSRPKPCFFSGRHNSLIVNNKTTVEKSYKLFCTSIARVVAVSVQNLTKKALFYVCARTRACARVLFSYLFSYTYIYVFLYKFWTSLAISRATDVQKKLSLFIIRYSPLLSRHVDVQKKNTVLDGWTYTQNSCGLYASS